MQHIFVAILLIHIEHTLQFNAHHIAPLPLGALQGIGEIEVIRLFHTLHLAPCHPLAIALERSLRKNAVAVHHKVLKPHVAALSRAPHRLILYTLEGAVLHLNVIYIATLLKAVQQHTVARLLARHILHIHVTHRRHEASLRSLFWLIHKVDSHNRLSALAHLYIPHVHTLGHTAATRVRLDAQHPVEVRRIHLAILSKHVLHTARNLRADNHASVTILHRASPHDDIP